MDAVQVTVIGAGVIGLAITRELTKHGISVLLLERNPTFGRMTSSRNSGVIHAGLYYPTGSLMARFCVKGNRLLYRYCKEASIPHRRLGKIIVSTAPEEDEALHLLSEKARENGVQHIEFLTKARLKRLEPHIRASSALFVPSTGIVDPMALMQALFIEARMHALEVAFNTSVTAVEPCPDGYLVSTMDTTGTSYSFQSQIVVNCAGLYADRVAGLLNPLWERERYRLYFCKGSYFLLNPAKGRLISHLVYPVRDPKAPGLGIHLTLDLQGGVRAGPDAQYTDNNAEDYSVDPSRAAGFVEALQWYFPSVGLEDLAPDFAGIRPKLNPPGTPQRDFVIQDEAEAGFPGFINLIGIESPGLTASLAIGQYVHGLVRATKILA